jgi:hypothetical protein
MAGLRTLALLSAVAFCCLSVCMVSSGSHPRWWSWSCVRRLHLLIGLLLVILPPPVPHLHLRLCSNVPHTPVELRDSLRDRALSLACRQHKLDRSCKVQSEEIHTDFKLTCMIFFRSSNCCSRTQDSRGKERSD